MSADVMEFSKARIYFTCVICGLIGLMLTFWWINSNYIQSPYTGAKKMLVEIESNEYEVHVVPTPNLTPVAEPASSVTAKAPNNILFHWNPTFMVWTMLILALMMICSVIFPSYLMVIRVIVQEFNLTRRSIVVPIAATLLSIGAMATIFFSIDGYYKPVEIIRDFHILLENHRLIPITATIPVFLIAPLMMTFFIVPFAADQLKFSEFSKSAVGNVVAHYTRLDRILQNSLNVLAIIVVLTILCSSALRESIKATITFKEIDIFPNEVSYVYGLFYTLFISMLYLPAHFVLQLQYEKLKEEFVRGVDGHSSEDISWSTKIFKEDVNNATIWDNIKLAATLFSPLISSFIPETLLT